MAIIHIYGARATFLLFYDNQGTESGPREIKIGVAGPIFTIKHQSLYGTTIFILHKMGSKYCGNFYIYGVRSILLLFCDHQDTESESYEI